MEKDILERFKKDIEGSFTTLLILGIILESKRVWTYQIKKKFTEITMHPENIPTSSFYSILNKLETCYGLIISEKDDSVQRRYYLPTEKGKQDFNRLKNYWSSVLEKNQKILDKLKN